MSATIAFDGSAFDRRALLRAALLGGAALTVTAAGATGASSLIERVTTGLERSSSSLPSAAAWRSLIGQEVVLSGGEFRRSVARVLDVTDVTRPSPGVALRGEAYSILFDVSSQPDASSVAVTVHHEDLGAPTLVLMPVNGDGSWEAVVDRRTLVTTP